MQLFKQTNFFKRASFLGRRKVCGLQLQLDVFGGSKVPGAFTNTLAHQSHPTCTKCINNSSGLYLTKAISSIVHWVGTETKC